MVAGGSRNWSRPYYGLLEALVARDRREKGSSLARLTALLFSDNLTFRKMTVPSIKKRATPTILKARVSLSDDTCRAAEDTARRPQEAGIHFPFLHFPGELGPVTNRGLCASSCITHLTSWPRLNIRDTKGKLEFLKETEEEILLSASKKW